MVSKRRPGHARPSEAYKEDCSAGDLQISGQTAAQRRAGGERQAIHPDARGPADLYEGTAANTNVRVISLSGCDLRNFRFWRAGPSSSVTRRPTIFSPTIPWQYGMRPAGSGSTAAVCSPKQAILAQASAADWRASAWMTCGSSIPRNRNAVILKKRKISATDARGSIHSCVLLIQTPIIPPDGGRSFRSSPVRLLILVALVQQFTENAVGSYWNYRLRNGAKSCSILAW